MNVKINSLKEKRTTLKPKVSKTKWVSFFFIKGNDREGTEVSDKKSLVFKYLNKQANSI